MVDILMVYSINTGRVTPSQNEWRSMLTPSLQVCVQGAYRSLYECIGTDDHSLCTLGALTCVSNRENAMFAA